MQPEHPDTLDTSAPVISRQSIVIPAPADVVWQLHTDIAAWPAWHPELRDASIDGEWAPGAKLTWHSGELLIASTVFQVEAGRSTLWGGTTVGVTGIHGFTFTPVDGGVRAETFESWTGDAVEADIPASQRMLDESLQAWLGHLAKAAESR